MTTRNYAAVIFREREPSSEGAVSYFTVFPDLPGCFTQAESLDQLFEHAVEAAELYLEDWPYKDLPAATPYAQIDVAKIGEAAGVFEEADVETVLLIPVALPGKAVKVTITLDEGLLERIDRAAAGGAGGRSGFLAEGARSLLERQSATGRLSTTKRKPRRKPSSAA